MSVPDNITQTHLLQAIEKIDREGIPTDGQSRYYDAFYGSNGKPYPPKLVLSYANLYANGSILIGILFPVVWKVIVSEY